MKRAFRLQIARYHPDKVQHLGQEFQAMAAERAAELTEAYRVRTDDGRRAEQRRWQRGTRLTLIPVDASNWEAHVPLDAPGIAKTLLARLRTGA